MKNVMNNNVKNNMIYYNKAYTYGGITMLMNHKLVRDRIPEMIQNSGKKCKTKILDNETFIIELKKKFDEELLEYKNAKTDKEAIEELADLLELIYTLGDIHGASIEEIELVRQKKAIERGGFQDKIFLIEVED